MSQNQNQRAIDRESAVISCVGSWDVNEGPERVTEANREGDRERQRKEAGRQIKPESALTSCVAQLGCT